MAFFHCELFYFVPFLTAPSFTLNEINMSAVVVDVQRPEEDPTIQFYRANIKNGIPEQACTILACIPPLTCEISNLTLGTNYTIEVKACVPGENACSASKEKGFSIKPPGKCTIPFNSKS